MNFHTSVDNAFQQENSTENMTRIMEDVSTGEEILTADEVKAILGAQENNSLSAYEDLHTIGLGGFGAVYAATEPGLERKLALKILRPRYRNQKERIQAFIREARITAQIAHPNIVPVHRIGVFDDAGLYFSMKRIGGETLRAVLKKIQENRPGYRKKYPLPRLLDIFEGACQGVFYAHQNGICHCDLKPENIMVGNFGEVLVMDWGMARDLPVENGGQKLQSADEDEKKHLGGTPVFMAPEHLSLSSNKPTVQSDIYALGCVLYSILTWKTSPFEGAETLEEIQKKVVQDKIVPPRRCAPDNISIPRELEAVCLKAMARNPEKRYQSVNDLLEDLRKYRDGLPVEAYSPSPLYKLGKFIFRRPLVPVVFFLALLTWCAFSVYSSVSEHFSVNALRNGARKAFRDGEQRLWQAGKRISQLKRGTLNVVQMEALETAIAADAANAEADFKNAMDILERIPDNYRNPQYSNMVVKRIFLAFTGFCNLSKNDEKLHDFAVLCNTKWKKLFHQAQKSDPQFRRLFSRALSGTGTILLTNTQNVKWFIEDSTGQAFPLQKNSSAEGSDEKIQLPTGLYTITAETADGRTKRIPVRSSLSVLHSVDLSVPSSIPQGMILIPGGDFSHLPDISNGFRRTSFEDDFLIKAAEVSVAEYLEFWKSIKDPELKKQYASYYFDHNDSLESLRAWDDDGKLLRPGLLMTHPITGISGLAADAYCAYLSQKLKRQVQLPSRAQWRKAAGGIDGTEFVWGDEYRSELAVINRKWFAPVGTTQGDCSIYGVWDLSGNVREFVKVAVQGFGLKGKYAIVGGSYHSLPAVAGISHIVYSSRGGNDVGFRYVMLTEKKESKK